MSAAEASASVSSLQFAPFASDIELPFYSALASHKINHDMLDDSARRLLGLYEVRASDRPDVSCRMQILGNSLISDDVPVGCCRAEGIIKNVNTIEDFRKTDKPAMLHRSAQTIWESIVDGTIYSCPSLLASFLALTYADLKKYKFTYWFAFPALHSDPVWKLDGERSEDRPSRLGTLETTRLVDRVQTWRYSVDPRQHGFFLVKRVRTPAPTAAAQSTNDAESNEHQDDGSNSPKVRRPSLGFSWDVASLSTFESGFFDATDPKDCFVAFVDPSTYPSNPGWMLRNLLVLARNRWKLDRVQILCYREVQSRRDDPKSIILNLKADRPNASQTSDLTSTMPKATGWERNREGKLSSRTANLADYLDPSKLADQSVDLNLKLMRWRIAPTLDLEKIKSTKCLLLGAGTLGSYVARNLLGWGVRHITFVDNGTVSYSNPVRQPLFNFNDCQGGGAKKAVRAAEALHEIYPGVTSEGHVFSVPMAGHPVTDEVRTKAAFKLLERLIDAHDVIFLLMDTRESRWLPTLMGKSAGKIVMNAALGFDTFVVMRHGLPLNSSPADLAEEATATSASPEETEHELGCYFCNDVVAPADSVKDQTLDQQCTVTRPGIAAIASALLVETLVSLLQHPKGGRAPAPLSQTSASVAPPQSTHPLGIVPHQIRGFLSTFQNLVVRGRAYDCCSACSDRVIDAYRAGGWDFVRRAVSERGYVEELSGLAEVQRRAMQVAHDIDWDEGSELDEAEEEGDGELL
ncbi:MAG: Autophagy protein 7 [Sarcosagium campestre]|nr:MAG: Autophagy protein 7 [Sarcosagium campestre]